MRKKIYVSALVLLTLFAGVAIAKIYWQREATYNFTVLGIEAIMTEKDYDDYRNKIETSVLDPNQQVVISILAENFYTVWLNVTETSDATGLLVTATGQYVNVHWVGPSTGTFDLVGSPFNVMGYTTYNETEKLKLMWADPGAGVGQPTGHGLLITFDFDTEGVTTPGDYQCTLKFQMGFVE